MTYQAKNVALAGVKSVTIYDPESVTIQDLSSQVCEDFTDFIQPPGFNSNSSSCELKISENRGLQLCCHGWQN